MRPGNIVVKGREFSASQLEKCMAAIVEDTGKVVSLRLHPKDALWYASVGFAIAAEKGPFRAMRRAYEKYRGAGM